MKEKTGKAGPKIIPDSLALARKDLLLDLPESEKITFLPFAIGREWYAVEVKYLKEVIKPVSITPIPETPSFLVGVINLRGEIISVFDIQEYLGSGSAKEIYQRILIVNWDNNTFSFLVETCKEVSHIPRTALQSPLSTGNSSKRESILGIFYHQEKMFTLLDISGIFFSPQLNSANW